ncbi:hypothetical protein CK620_03305 [Vandammella animalimorsus]|uniref:VWFA domain-containing protein n=2 Tax=Vandammella animalimorsus TaxID=2029117 RepID=A0A2A2AF17_9BURK|nr:hypothetical protein CK620_03305 [Vandammella animalimorsus]
MQQVCAAACALFALSSPALAQNQVPSCYKANKIENPSPALEREVFILIDQTTPFDEGLQRAIMENADRLLKPGTGFAIASFSSFGQGRYMEILAEGAFEKPLPDDVRRSTGVKILQNLNQCLKDQHAYGRKLAAQALQKAFSGISAGLAHSDVLASIREMSRRAKDSTAQDKIFFVASDMLEHSAISSFYANRNVRLLNVQAEMKKVQEHGMLAQLADARVFVIGAGLVQDARSKNAPKDSGIYRDPKKMGALKGFWEAYFQQSQGRLEEFGMPALLRHID